MNRAIGPDYPPDLLQRRLQPFEMFEALVRNDRGEGPRTKWQAARFGVNKVEQWSGP
jgi:hypothetical protein